MVTDEVSIPLNQRYPFFNDAYNQHRKKGKRKLEYIPYSDKLDINVNRESSFKSCALFPSLIVFGNIHLVCERDLLVIAYRQETDLLN